jgi:hypothetical protein
VVTLLALSVGLKVCCLGHGAVSSVLVTNDGAMEVAVLLMMLGTVAVRASTRELAAS